MIFYWSRAQDKRINLCYYFTQASIFVVTKTSHYSDRNRRYDISDNIQQYSALFTR